jgi:hypothetical protein
MEVIRLEGKVADKAMEIHEGCRDNGGEDGANNMIC